jgi:hypothetical protein
VACDEDEPEEVVVERVVDGGLRGLLDLRQATDLLDLALVDVRPAHPVDAAMLGRGHEPGARVIRDARLRPLLEGGDERLLSEVLGEADVTHEARGARDQARGLDSPHGLDRASDVGLGHG